MNVVGGTPSSEFLDFESSLEDLVEDIISTGKKAKSKKTQSKKFGTRQMQRTYLEICRNSLTPIVRYVKAINIGVTVKDLVEVTALIVQPLIKKTSQVGLEQEARKLRSFHVVLQSIQRSKSSKITNDQAASLFEVYWPVHEAFELNMRGHSLAVANLLSFYKKTETQCTGESR